MPNFTSTGHATGAIRALLQIEGAVIGAAAVALYASIDATWWLFSALILAPDLAIVGYGLGKRIGALAYNITHSYVLPFGLGALGLWGGIDLALPLAAIWTAHIGFDRALGYGLKYAEGFKHTNISAPDLSAGGPVATS